VAAHELLAHDHLENAVAEELESLVRRLTTRRPRAVGEDLTAPTPSEARDDVGKAGVSDRGDQAMFART
jgi:hypothetical protein